MSKVLCEKSDLIAIADSVRNKTGTTGGMKVSEIPQKIGSDRDWEQYKSSRKSSYYYL